MAMICDVFDLVEFRDFDYSKYYDGEQDIIKPQLEELSYKNVSFYNIEADSFGPLVRGVKAECGITGDIHEFYYG